MVVYKVRAMQANEYVASGCTHLKVGSASGSQQCSEKSVMPAPAAVVALMFFFPTAAALTLAMAVGSAATRRRQLLHLAGAERLERFRCRHGLRCKNLNTLPGKAAQA